MSSSSLPRAVAIQPGGAHTARWSLGELPSRGHSVAAPEADTSRMEAANEAGYARGYEQGFRAGEFAESSRVRAAVNAVDSALAAIEQESAKWTANAEENICAIAIAVARHVLGRKLTVDRSWVVTQVKAALAEFPVGERLRVRMNPADLQVIAQALAADGAALGGRPVRWTSDARMSTGSCLVEGHERMVDGRVDTALERLYRRLADAGR